MPLVILRMAVLSAFVFALVIALASWAVRRRHISPFGRPARTIRRLTDPILEPIERGLLQRGGNPQNAEWWLVGIVMIGGILLITAGQWAETQWFRWQGASAGGPRAVIRLVVYYAGQLVLFALIVRVIGSWVGVGRYNRWMRLPYLLTDWIIGPLSRIIPPFGAIDITPLIAWLLLQLLLPLLVRAI